MKKEIPSRPLSNIYDVAATALVPFQGLVEKMRMVRIAPLPGMKAEE